METKYHFFLSAVIGSVSYIVDGKDEREKISESNWIEQNQTFFSTINSTQVLKMTSAAFGLAMLEKNI